MLHEKIFISDALYAAIGIIREAGHGVELRNGEGGNSHISTILTIGVRSPTEAGYIAKIDVKHVLSYGGKYSEFIGFDEKFGKDQFTVCKTIEPLLAHAIAVFGQPKTALVDEGVNHVTDMMPPAP